MSGSTRYKAVLHPNERRRSEQSPDYYGLVSLGEERYRVAAWKNENRFGEYISLVFTPVEQDGARREARPTARSVEDDFVIPF